MQRLLFFIISLLLFGCQKENESGECDGIDTPTATATKTLDAGSSIQLTATGYTARAAYYLWSGPNGFTSTEQNPEIKNAQSNNAGKYTVEVRFDGGCLKTATTDEVVITVGAAPCSPTNNTATVEGVATTNFYNVNGSASGGSYFIKATGSSGDIELEFPGTSKPVAGVYSIQPLSGSWVKGDVRLRAVAQSSNWPASTGKVYVTVTNNKVSASFCAIPVRSQTFSINSTVSGKVTEQ